MKKSSRELEVRGLEGLSQERFFSVYYKYTLIYVFRNGVISCWSNARTRRPGLACTRNEFGGRMSVKLPYVCLTSVRSLFVSPRPVRGSCTSEACLTLTFQL